METQFGPHSNENGFSATELKVVLIICFVVFFVVGQRFVKREPLARRNRCINNLSGIGLAFRMYAADNDGRFPASSVFTGRTDISSIAIADLYRRTCLSNASVFHCPDDSQRRPAASMSELFAENISYFLSLSANAEMPNAFLAGDRRLELNGRQRSGIFALTTSAVPVWSKPIHYDVGYVLTSDGSIHAMSDARLRQMAAEQRMATNYLVFP